MITGGFNTPLIIYTEYKPLYRSLNVYTEKNGGERDPFYLQDLVQICFGETRVIFQDLLFLLIVLIHCQFPVWLLEHLEDCSPDGQVEDDSRGQ